VVAATLDPDGRKVVLTEERWVHIKAEHATLAPKLREIMAAVRDPVRSTPGRGENEVWFYAEDAGRFLWIQVVVHYERGEGSIVTAFPRSTLP
jgi:hypothetical protein